MPSTNSDSFRLTRECHALTEIAKAVTSPLELQELLDSVMKTIIEVVEQADLGVLMLWDQSTGLFRSVAGVGFDMEALKEMGLRSGESITGKAFDEGEIILLSTPEEVLQATADMREFNRNVFARSVGSQEMPRAAVAAPVFAGDQKFGVLVLETFAHHKQFTQADLPFVQTLADLMALAIDRSRLEARADVVRQAHQVERMRSEVMATLSHELRMPLSAIKGYATALMLDEIAWSATTRDGFLNQIVNACDDMESMVMNMLDSALIEVDQMKLEYQPVRLQYMAREVALEVQTRSKLHRMVVEFPADFPIVEADPRWIKQVFRNILDNAVKYSPEGGLIVIQGEARLGNAVVTIADQGVGISPEDMIPLFEKYFRVRSLATLHVPGAGLGLPISRTIIEAHGGRIWAESKIGEGTSVSFSLPVSHSGKEDGD